MVMRVITLAAVRVILFTRHCANGGGGYNIHLQFQDGSNSPCGQIFSYLENVEKMIHTYRVYQASDYIINWTYEAIISSLLQYHLD